MYAIRSYYGIPQLDAEGLEQLPGRYLYLDFILIRDLVPEVEFVHLDVRRFLPEVHEGMPGGRYGKFPVFG